MGRVSSYLPASSPVVLQVKITTHTLFVSDFGVFETGAHVALTSLHLISTFQILELQACALHTQLLLSVVETLLFLE